MSPSERKAMINRVFSIFIMSRSTATNSRLASERYYAQFDTLDMVA